MFSTLHTNDCASSVARLLDMGVVPYMAAAALTGVIAQRLVKKLCPFCRQEYRPGEAEREALAAVSQAPATTLFKPVGCARCNGTGYIGRRAIYEFMELDEKMKSMILRGASPQKLRRVLRAGGNMSLRDQAARMVVDGETSMEELEKIIYSAE